MRPDLPRIATVFNLVSAPVVPSGSVARVRRYERSREFLKPLRFLVPAAEKGSFRRRRGARQRRFHRFWFGGGSRSKERIGIDRGWSSVESISDRHVVVRHVGGRPLGKVLCLAHHSLESIPDAVPGFVFVETDQHVSADV